MDMQQTVAVTAKRPRTSSLPIIDPRKDLITVADQQASESFREAYAYVCHRAREDGLAMSYEGNRSKPYPIMSGICCLHKDAEKLLRQRIKTVFTALQKIVGSYHHDESLQEFLAIPEPLNRWVMRDVQPSHRSVDLCRFDMMGRNLDELRIIEFNT